MVRCKSCDFKVFIFAKVRVECNTFASSAHEDKPECLTKNLKNEGLQ